MFNCDKAPPLKNYRLSFKVLSENQLTTEFTIILYSFIRLGLLWLQKVDFKVLFKCDKATPLKNYHLSFKMLCENQSRKAFTTILHSFLRGGGALASKSEH